MLIPINPRKNLDMTDDRFLVLFSNYSSGDRYNKLVPAGRGGTLLSIAPVSGVEASQPSTVQSIDLIQRPSDYIASSNVMKEILQKSVDKSNRERHGVVIAPKLTKKRDKQPKSSSNEASSDTIFQDYHKLKTKKNKQDFITALGHLYSQNPTGSDYILKGIQMIKVNN